jgi:hypothetical protein
MADEKKDHKAPPTPTGSTIEGGHVTEELLLSPNGLPLWPQPVRGDDLDPLNWSKFQKHVILAIVMALYVVPDEEIILWLAELRLTR